MTAVAFAAAPPVVEAWLERRRGLGQDLYDERWEGVYVVAPEATGSHGWLDSELARSLYRRGSPLGLRDSGPLNVGDEDDFRVPDRALLRPHEHPQTWHPTVTVAVEILSPGEKGDAKFAFYLAHGVEEILLVEGRRRTVQWWSRSATGFDRTGRSELLDCTEAELAEEITWPPPDADD